MPAAARAMVVAMKDPGLPQQATLEAAVSKVDWCTLRLMTFEVATLVVL